MSSREMAVKRWSTSELPVHVVEVVAFPCVARSYAAQRSEPSSPLPGPPRHRPRCRISTFIEDAKGNLNLRAIVDDEGEIRLTPGRTRYYDGRSLLPATHGLSTKLRVAAQALTYSASPAHTPRHEIHSITDTTVTMSAAASPLPYSTPTSNGSTTFGHSGERAFEHIDDLKAKVATYNPTASIPSLLRIAEVSLEQAYTLNTYKRPDLAFVEFVRASEIVVDVIPRHRDYVHFTVDQPEPAKPLQVLQKRVSAGNEQFAAIKQIIVNNNKRSGVRPRSAGQQNGLVNGHARTESAPVNGLPNGSAQVKVRPTPSPKPEGMHGRAISTATAKANAAPVPTNDLSERFAQLRMNTTMRPDSRASNSSTITNSPVSMPTPQDYNGRNSFEPLARTPSLPYKPQGPRGMPQANGMPAPILIPNLPQAPQAAYSPARNMDTGMGNIAPPRHSARSLASSSTRRSSMAPSSSASYHAPNGNAGSGEYFPSSASNGTARPAPPSAPRRTSTTVPMEPDISPEKLYDYNQRYHLLLIDFRSRADFDQGHIFTRNILCVEPLSIRQGMSAEQVADTLVLSPESEQEMWAQRDQYDFVVYYDQEMRDVREREESKHGLRWLHEALVDFNQEKPL